MKSILIIYKHFWVTYDMTIKTRFGQTLGQILRLDKMRAEQWGHTGNRITENKNCVILSKTTLQFDKQRAEEALLQV